MIVAWMNEKKPTFLGLLTGAVAGLATITPASGYVSPTTAVIIGVIAGVVCLLCRCAEEHAALGRRTGCLGRHGVGGALGIVLLGVFADKAFNPAGQNGLLLGNHWFFIKQVAATVFSSFWHLALPSAC